MFRLLVEQVNGCLRDVVEKGIRLLKCVHK